jgi:hypothetical protein
MKVFAIGDGHKCIRCPAHYVADEESEDTVIIWDPLEPEMPIRVTIITINHPEKDVSRLAFDRVVSKSREKGTEAQIIGNVAVHAYQTASADGVSVNCFREAGFANHFCLFTLTVPVEKLDSPLMAQVQQNLDSMIASLTAREAAAQFNCDLLESDHEAIRAAESALLSGVRGDDAWETLQTHYEDSIARGDEVLVRSVGLAFGELLRAEIPTLTWSVKIDDYGRDRALDYPDSGISTFPEAMLQKRFDRGEKIKLRELAEGVFENIEELFRKYAVSAEAGR